MLEATLRLLASDRCESDYVVAAEVLWGTALDKCELPVNKVIALLYDRFDPQDADENNRVWSITKLKNLDYLSEYEPLTDTVVIRELEPIRQRRGVN